MKNKSCYNLDNEDMLREVTCKPVAYLSSHNQHKYYQVAEKYKLSVKLPFGVVGSVLAV